MKRWLGFTMAVVACATAATVACSGKTSGSSDTNACDDYFQAYFGGSCNSVLPPASEVSRVQGRFATLCAAALALPGSSVTSASLEACASAVKSGGCPVLDQAEGPCSFGTGSLPSGSSCFTGGQCQGGDCSANTHGADGSVSLCGTCSTLPAVGQPCPSGQCAKGASCSSSNGGASSCVAVTQVGVGASCVVTTGAFVECDAGLYCDQLTEKCTATGGAGSACMQGDACTSPLVCPPAAQGASSTCQSPGAAGAACGGDQDCGSSLGCDQTTRQCGSVTWVSAGQACSDNVRCLVGSCSSGGGTAGGTCPTVIADGQPCNLNDSSSTCDTVASCEGGTCVLGYPSCS